PETPAAGFFLKNPLRFIRSPAMPEPCAAWMVEPASLGPHIGSLAALITSFRGRAARKRALRPGLRRRGACILRCRREAERSAQGLGPAALTLPERQCHNLE